MKLEQHPLSAAFPAMPDQEMQALALDIEKNGQREPGVLFEGMVLDGWHRKQACEIAGVKFSTVTFDGPDPVAFVISRNAHRRHLTASQKAHAVAACAQWRTRGGDQSAPGALRGKTDAELAEQAGVSERTVEQAKTAIRAGLGEAVKTGKVSAKRAAEVAKLPPKQRERALNQAPKREKPKGEAALRAELIEVQGKFADLAEKHADLADTARELEDKVTCFETTDLDEQQKLIADLQKKLRKAEGEIEHQKRRANDLQAKCNELIREVKKLRRG